MANFQAVYYRDRKGREPVSEYIDGLDQRCQDLIDTQIDRLNMLSGNQPHLPYPHSSQIEGEFREFRCHCGSDLYRILYRWSDRLLVLLHIFYKKTKRVPKSEIRIAKRRWKDFKLRMDAEVRELPRAVGRDAP